jgi:uncharacterized membrane protein
MRIHSILLALAILGSGLVAGVFLAFSTFVMRAIDQTPPVQAVQTMQNINVTVFTPLFMIPLFGTVLLGAYLGFAIGGRWVWLGALIYALGVVGVTMVCNVPLNNEMARISLSDPEIAVRWSAFYRPWMMWNHVRCLASAVACLCFVMALVVR